MKRRALIALGTALGVLSAVFAVMAVLRSGGLTDNVTGDLSEYGPPEETETPADATPSPSAWADAFPAEADSEPAKEPYESPVDFDSLKEINADIYAWMEIPGTNISYPILHREGDDGYYLTHGGDGEKSKDGALFSEDYNGLDFSDPVTIVYGHNMKSGNMFGNLQEYYTNEDFFKENGEIDVYLPDRKLKYHIFAAVPFSSFHILYYCDFSNERIFYAFIDSVYSIRSLNAVLDDDVEIRPDDKILILSTCLKGDDTRRFLVMAVQQSTD